MPFLIETWDKPGSAELRARTRPDHIAYLEANLGRLLGAGAKLSDDGETALGTVYVIDTESREEAQAFADADPFTRAGLPDRMVLTRWRKAIFDHQSFIVR
jgi:uncharacterized protein YciI